MELNRIWDIMEGIEHIMYHNEPDTHQRVFGDNFEQILNTFRIIVNHPTTRFVYARKITRSGRLKPTFTVYNLELGKQFILMRRRKVSGKLWTAHNISNNAKEYLTNCVEMHENDRLTIIRFYSLI